MAKKHVVIAAVAGGVALTIAGGVAVAMALHKNDVTLSVDGESHNLSVREDTVQQVLEKDGITVGEHDVVAPSLETKITNGMEISVLYGRQLQLTVDGEARTVWTTARTVDDDVQGTLVDDTGAVAVVHNLLVAVVGNTGAVTAKDGVSAVGDKTGAVTHGGSNCHAGNGGNL